MCRVTNCRHNCSWIGGIFTESHLNLSQAKTETFLWSGLALPIRSLCQPQVVSALRSRQTLSGACWAAVDPPRLTRF